MKLDIRLRGKRKMSMINTKDLYCPVCGGIKISSYFRDSLTSYVCVKCNTIFKIIKVEVQDEGS